jgi:hypothetical protein
MSGCGIVTHRRALTRSALLGRRRPFRHWQRADDDRLASLGLTGSTGMLRPIRKAMESSQTSTRHASIKTRRRIEEHDPILSGKAHAIRK